MVFLQSDENESSVADPQDFGLLDPHPESTFQVRIPDAKMRISKISAEI